MMSRISGSSTLVFDEKNIIAITLEILMWEIYLFVDLGWPHTFVIGVFWGSHLQHTHSKSVSVYTFIWKKNRQFNTVVHRSMIFFWIAIHCYHIGVLVFPSGFPQNLIFFISCLILWYYSVLLDFFVYYISYVYKKYNEIAPSK